MKNTPAFASFAEYEAALNRALAVIVGRVPALKERCVLHGTAAASTAGFKHRESWDVDLMTAELMDDVSDLAKKLTSKFPGKMQWLVRDEEAQMFRGRLTLDGLPEIPIDLFQNVHDSIKIKSTPRPAMNGMPAVSLGTYAQEKTVAFSERRETKDLYDICACYRSPVTRDETKRTLTRLGYDAVKTLQARLAGIGAGLRDFVSAQPGFDPVDEETEQELATYLSIRRSQYEMVINARRQERAISFY